MPLASRSTRVPVAPADAARDRSAPGKVTGKLLTAMQAMVWNGMTRLEAATKAGMSEHSLYAALKRAHVRQWYLTELDVLRTSERARNIHVLCEVRDDPTNKMARVQAVRTLEGMSEDGPSGYRNGMPAVPGLVIQIVTNAPAPQGVTIEHKSSEQEGEP